MLAILFKCQCAHCITLCNGIMHVLYAKPAKEYIVAADALSMRQGCLNFHIVKCSQLINHKECSSKYSK